MVDPKFEVEPVSDRHPKWKRVEPGTIIPAGQPYRVETPDEIGCTATEYLRDEPWLAAENGRQWFVDSSWKPPLALPTELTLGILRTKHPAHMGSIAYWFHDTQTDQVEGRGPSDLAFVRHNRDYVLDFIPLTPEQVARIEAAR